MDINDQQFEELINSAMDDLPEEYVTGLNNVVIVFEDDPSEEQRQELKLRGGQSLFGLYQGIPRTKRNNSYSFVLPDKITLFKKPILRSVSNMEELKNQIRHTLWHEIAHHYGLGHDRIQEIEARWQ